MGIRKSVFISLGSKPNSSITDNNPIRRSVVKKDLVTSEVSPPSFNNIFLRDSTTILDAIAKFVSKVIIDSVSIVDIAALNFSTPKQNFNTLSDTINIGIQLQKSDEVFSEDFGLAFAQNYTVDNTYFLEDYVGQSRQFT
jgi:hypothetical protein